MQKIVEQTNYHLASKFQINQLNQIRLGKKQITKFVLARTKFVTSQGNCYMANQGSRIYIPHPELCVGQPAKQLSVSNI